MPRKKRSYCGSWPRCGEYHAGCATGIFNSDDTCHCLAFRRRREREPLVATATRQLSIRAVWPGDCAQITSSRAFGSSLVLEMPSFPRCAGKFRGRPLRAIDESDLRVKRIAVSHHQKIGGWDKPYSMRKNCCTSLVRIQETSPQMQHTAQIVHASPPLPSP